MMSAKQIKTLDAERLFKKADQYDEKGDFKNAFKCFLAAAQLGNTGCQVNLGNYYSWGKGVRKDPDKGVYWYKKAYKNGYGTGAFNLAMQRKSEGNLRSAVFWFKKIVAKNNDGDACVELAKIYIGRKGGQNTAANLLKRALRMNERLMSGGAKEEAESLLKKISTTKKRRS
jgi:TPR repeat protein